MRFPGLPTIGSQLFECCKKRGTLVEMTATLRSPFNLSAHLRPTIGDQKMTYVATDHMGWMLCDGRLLSRTTYALLFNVIGETFGAGDGSTTFKLPDFRGTVPGMAGQPSWSNDSNNVNPTSNALGSFVGEQLHRLTIGEMPSHKHGSVDVSGNTNGNGLTGYESTHTHTYQDAYFAENTGGGGLPGSGSTDNDNAFRWRTAAGGASTTPSDIDTSGGTAHNHSIGSTGGSNYHNNMQPTLFAGNMFIYSGRNMDAYFPYTWVNNTPGNVAIY